LSQVQAKTYSPGGMKAGIVYSNMLFGPVGQLPM
jgi:hypothetical protein